MDRRTISAAAMRPLRSFAEIIDLGWRARQELVALLDTFDVDPGPIDDAIPTGATAE